VAAKKTPLKLSTQEIGELERMARSQTVEHRRVVRAQIILRLSKGESLSAVARTVGLSRRIIMKWDKRFRDKRVEGLARKHLRFKMHFTPVHCSWMNQVEQWFGILKKKRFAATNFADVPARQERIEAFIAEWNATAHPFRWTVSSCDKVLAKCESTTRRAA